jgi:DNA-binding transcriptional ArsR family regulator
MPTRPARRARSSKTLDCIQALKALSDPRRVRILNLLLTEALTAGAIARGCRLTPYTASRQLAALLRAKLVTCDKEGQHRVYRISGACAALIDKSARTLDLGCCQFRLDAIVEGAGRR